MILLLGCFHGGIRYSFRTYFHHPRTEATYPIVHSSRASGLRVDSTLASTVRLLHQMLQDNGYQDGDPIIGGPGLSGVVYLLNGVSPGVLLGDLEFPKLAAYSLERTQADLSRCVVIGFDQEALQRFLAETPVPFPQAYKQVGQVGSLKVWIPRSSGIR